MRITRHTAVLGLAAGALSIGIASTPALAEDSNNHDWGTGRSRTVSLQILSFNDYHGHLEPPTGSDATLGALDPTFVAPTPGVPGSGNPGTAVGGAEYLSSKLTELRAAARHSLTVTAGDLIGGSPFLSGLFHDEPSVESLEAMELDVSGVGNHEFDEGFIQLYRMQDGGCHIVDGCYFPDEPYDGADFPWLAANVTFTGTRRTVLPPTWTKMVDGVKVGFIGMTLEGTPELVAAKGIQGLSFNDEVESANLAVQKLEEHGVETIVVLLHEGGVQTGTYQGCTGISGPIVEIAENLDPEIDLVVTGHTHQPYICSINDPEGNPRQVTSASSFGRVVTETTLTIDRTTEDVVRTATVSTNHLVTRVSADPAITEIITKWRALADPIANRVVGTIVTDVPNPGDRQAESPMANLIADAQLAATASPENGGAVIALMNPGGVRGSLSFTPSPAGEGPGEVTYGEAFTIQPFGNLLVTMDLTGAQLQAVLEQQYFPRGNRTQLVFGVSAGLTFDVTASAPQGSRVSNVQFQGAPIDPLASYRVVVNNFLADGGDGFTVFRDGTNRVGGGDDLVALIDYLAANSPVAPPATDRINELP